MHRLLGILMFLSVASCNAEFGLSGRYEKWLKGVDVEIGIYVTEFHEQ